MSTSAIIFYHVHTKCGQDMGPASSVEPLRSTDVIPRLKLRPALFHRRVVPGLIVSSANNTLEVYRNKKITDFINRDLTFFRTMSLSEARKYGYYAVSYTHLTLPTNREV